MRRSSASGSCSPAVGSAYRLALTGTGGNPGWSIECTIAGIFKVQDTCTSAKAAPLLTNVSGGEDATFEASESASCSLGNASSGMVIGSDLTENPSGKTLSVGGLPEAPTTKEQEGGKNPGTKNIESCPVGDPIDCATGNLSEEQTDISIGGRGPGLRVMRSYNSLAAAEATTSGLWGYGWTGPYSSHLEINTGAATATVFQENGSDVVFFKSGSTYAPASWVQATLAESGSDYIYTLPDQSKLEFNSSGQLLKETERNGNSNTMTYNGSKQLEKVSDEDSRLLTFKYNGGGEVESVTDPMSHVVEYAYSSGNLAKVTIEGKVRWEYEYEGHLLKKMKDGRGDATTNEYDSSHRVIKQVIAGHERKLKYASTPGTETTLTEPNGSETLEQFNAAGEPIKITKAVGVSGVETTTEYKYNGEYELTKLSDPNKHVTEYGYNTTGDRTSDKDPNGDEKKWGLRQHARRRNGNHPRRRDDDDQTQRRRGPDDDRTPDRRQNPGNEIQIRRQRRRRRRNQPAGRHDQIHLRRRRRQGNRTGPRRRRTQVEIQRRLAGDRRNQPAGLHHENRTRRTGPADEDHRPLDAHDRIHLRWRRQRRNGNRRQVKLNELRIQRRKPADQSLRTEQSRRRNWLRLRRQDDQPHRR
jgi:YD repeat-containing protein